MPWTLLVLMLLLSHSYVAVNRSLRIANPLTYRPIASDPILQIFLIDSVVYGCRTCATVPNVLYYNFYF